MNEYYQEQFKKISLLHKKKLLMESKRREVTCNGAFEIYTDIISDIEKEIAEIKGRMLVMEG